MKHEADFDLGFEYPEATFDIGQRLVASDDFFRGEVPRVRQLRAETEKIAVFGPQLSNSDAQLANQYYRSRQHVAA